MKKTFFKFKTTFILKIAILIAAIMIILVCLSSTYWMVQKWNSDKQYIMIILVAGLFISSIPFIIALCQANKILKYIDDKNAFSEVSVKALTNIMYCAIILFVFITIVGIPFFIYWAIMDRAYELIVVGVLIDIVTFVIAIFASLLKYLFQEAISIKSENDLTV